jgi:hypothetical protein
VYPVWLRFDFGVIYDVFPEMISCLNIFGMGLALFLYYKGLNFPSTADCGRSVSQPASKPATGSFLCALFIFSLSLFFSVPFD